MSSMYEIFAFETNGFLDKVEELLMKSESDGADIMDAVPELFRVMHTIKSSSAMMSFGNISKLAHAVEDLFGYLRDQRPAQVDKARLADVVLDCVDFIKRNMEPGSSESPDEKIAQVKALLEAFKRPPAAEAAAPQPEATGASEAAPQPVRGAHQFTLNIGFIANCQMLGLRAFEVENKLKKSVVSVTADPDNDAEGAEEKIREKGLVLTISSEQTVEEVKAQIKQSPFVESVRECTPDQLAPAASAAEPPAKSAPAEAAPAAQPPQPGQPGFVERRADRSAAFANVAVQKLDSMVDLVGELVITDMRLRHLWNSGDQAQVDEAYESLEKLIHQVQELALSIRMLSVQDTFHKLNRSVRDMVRKQEKDVQFIMHGEETEVDKSVVDNIFTPLIHIIRNSIDHGIESPDVREKAGKPRQGVVTLSATAEGSEVSFTVTDDGRGFERDKIAMKALEKGLITEEKALTMTNDEINALIFMPGFSTNDTVTEFSGRGVGMDVVHDSMKKLGGKVSMTSEPGQGTSITLKIPLTLAILDALILTAGEESATLPLGAVKEIFVPTTESIREVNGQDTVLFREQCYPIVKLRDFYGDRLPLEYTDGVMLLVKSEQNDYVIFADEVADHRSVVVKPVPRLLKSIKGIYGCTILGNGKVSLILDVTGFQNAHHSSRKKG